MSGTLGPDESLRERAQMPSSKKPTQQSVKPFEKLSPEAKEHVLREAKRLLDAERLYMSKLGSPKVQ